MLLELATVFLDLGGLLNPGRGPVFLRAFKENTVITWIMLYTHQKTSLKKLKLKEWDTLGEF